MSLPLETITPHTAASRVNCLSKWRMSFADFNSGINCGFTSRRVTAAQSRPAKKGWFLSAAMPYSGSVPVWG